MIINQHIFLGGSGEGGAMALVFPLTVEAQLASKNLTDVVKFFFLVEWFRQ